MHDSMDGELIDIGDLRLERAVRRFERQDHEGGLEDLRAALRQMRWAGADPHSIESIASLVAAAEQRVS